MIVAIGIVAAMTFWMTACAYFGWKHPTFPQLLRKVLADRKLAYAWPGALAGWPAAAVGARLRRVHQACFGQLPRRR